MWSMWTGGERAHQDAGFQSGNIGSVEDEDGLDFEVEQLANTIVEDHDMAIARVSHTFGRLMQPNANV